MSLESPIHDYFVDLSSRLARLAQAHDAEIEPPAISSRVATEVLELAATVAHTSERKYAPLASFVTGIAVGELRAAGRLVSDGEIAAFVAQLRQELDVPTVR
jgi:Domain of unknown function (DUF6457)